MQKRPPPLKIGDTLESAIWLSGKETAEMLAHCTYEVKEQLETRAEADGIILGPCTAVIKQPGDDRVPVVPDGVSGPDVRLLVYEADVIGIKPVLKVNSFLNDLDAVDLMRLRAITYKAHRLKCPHEPPLTQIECDDIIEERGLVVAVRDVQGAVDSKTVH